MNLSEIVLNDLINKFEVGKLMFLYGLNKTNNKQKDIIKHKIFTSPPFIIDAVEKYPDDLNHFKYKDEILTLYELIVNVNNYDLNHYLDNMIYHGYKHEHNGVFSIFNENDEGFLLYLLYRNLKYSDLLLERNYRDKEVYRIFIEKELPMVDYAGKIVGLFRIKDFYNIDRLDKSRDIDTYVDLWVNKYKNSKELFYFPFRDHIGGNVIFSHTFGHNNGSVSVNIWNNNTFNVNILDKVDREIVMLETDINGKIFKHDGKYYLSEYNETCKMIYRVDTLANIRPYNFNTMFIKSASTKLNNIAPFITGDSKRIKKSFEGYIENGNYIKKNVYKSDIDLSADKVRAIYYEFENLNLNQH